MAISPLSHIQEREGTLYIGETRVTLASLVAAWRTEGYTPEELRLGFPALSLAEVYGAIAYYLDHQATLDTQFAADAQRYAEQRARDRAADPDFYRTLDERRARLRERMAPPSENGGDPA